MTLGPESCTMVGMAAIVDPLSTADIDFLIRAGDVEAFRMLRGPLNLQWALAAHDLLCDEELL